jgi:uncharacterized delta-60 repeat protein
VKAAGLLALLAAMALAAPPAYAAAGVLDPRFSGDGIATAFDGRGVATAVAVDHAGRIVVAGYTVDGPADVAVARYHPNGRFDRGFGDGGRVRIDLGGADYGFAVAITPGDGVVVAGRRTAAGVDRMFALRLDPSGAPVATFGTGGVALVGFGWRLQSAAAVAITRFGRVVLGGYTSNGTGIRSAVARLLVDGSLDPSFGTGGRVVLDVSLGGEQVNGLVILPKGRIVAAGSADAGSQPSFSLFRLLPDGHLDTAFGTRGITRTNLSAGADVGRAVVRTPDGHLAVAGFASDGGAGDWGIVRYGPGGRRDPTFGSGGEVLLRFSAALDEATGVAAAGAMLIVVGRIHRAGGDDAGVVRLRAGGARDPSFGAAGVVRIDLRGAGGPARAVAVQPDGRIVAAGTAWRGGSPRFFAARLLAASGRLPPGPMRGSGRPGLDRGPPVWQDEHMFERPFKNVGT